MEKKSSKGKAAFVKSLTPALFWDVDAKTIDAEAHAPYVAERVLSLGTLEDFKKLKAFYGKPRLSEIVVNLRYLDDRVLHFCSAYFDIPITLVSGKDSGWQ